MESTWLGISFEVFEIFTLCLMWTCAVVYARNLVSKHLTATAQAVIVIAHFCLGKNIIYKIHYIIIQRRSSNLIAKHSELILVNNVNLVLQTTLVDLCYKFYKYIYYYNNILYILNIIHTNIMFCCCKQVGS
jgi:hypothetical protein